MSSNLVPCPHCIANVRKNKLNSHIDKVHRKQKSNTYAAYRDTGDYRSAQTPQTWSWDRGYYSNTGYDTYNSYDRSHAEYDYYPVSSEGFRDTYSQRSSTTSLSEVSGFQSRTAGYLADSSDTESYSSNISHGKLGGDNSWIVFSSPTSIVTQRRSDGFTCPVPQCRKRFAEVEDVIEHARSKHNLERCPHCKGVNLKHQRTLEDHMQEIHQKEPQYNRTNERVSSSSRPSSSCTNSSKPVSTTHVTPRKEEKLIPELDKLQTSKDSEKSNSIKPPTRPTSVKTEPKESIKMLPANYISKSSGINKEPSTDSSNKSKLETSNKQSKMINEKQQINQQISSSLPVTAVSKYPSRPNTPNTATNSSEIVKKSANLSGDESDVEIISNGTDRIEMSTDEVNFINSHRDPELENDTNFKFINTGDLIGYSLNIR